MSPADTNTDYTEVAPLGPTDNGDAAGQTQMSTAYGRRFVRPLADGRFVVLDVESYVVNMQLDSGKPAEPNLSLSFGFTICADGADPIGTEVDSITHEDPDVPYAWTTEEAADTDAFRLCQEFEVRTADLGWTLAFTGEVTDIVG